MVTHKTHDIHDLAIQVAIQELTSPIDEIFFCAILKHEKSPSQAQNIEDTDFLWLKCKGHYKISKLLKTYSSYYKGNIDNIVLQFDQSLPSLETQIQSLDSRGDKLVVFWAREKAVNPMSRQPLQQGYSQANVKSEPSLEDLKSPVKSEAVSDHKSLDSIPSSSQVPHSDELSSSSSLADDEACKKFLKEKIVAKFGPAPLRPSNLELATSVFQKIWNTMTPLQKAPYTTSDPSSATLSHRPNAKPELEDGNTFDDDSEDPNSTPYVSKAAEKSRLQNLLNTATPEMLESEVQKGMELLAKLAKPLSAQQVSPDAQQWLSQVTNLQKQKINSPTIIGVVGETGSGKSSTINALLDEDRLLPTSCMRACTAVVTELSWNNSEDENERYRAAIEFISAQEWERELKIIFQDLIDGGSGNVSNDSTNGETEAGVAYAKIKAVYPRLTREEMANSTVERLMDAKEVRDILGTTKTVSNKNADIFYKRLNRFVDSAEKEKGKKKEKGEAYAMEYWPLIKVVRVQTKADALSTGAVVVDLPGVHDSNAARSAVAAGYLKQCTGLWVVAPVTRAVDNRSAKTLLGESFKRQLKFDGTYSRITFICSKTDDISITEAAESLGIQDEMNDLWEESDSLDKELEALRTKTKDLQETKAVYREVFDDADELLDQWEDLLTRHEDGEEVFAPEERAKNKPKNSKKRKHSESPQKQRKKRRSSDDSDDESAFESNADETDAEKPEDDVVENKEPLTEDQIESKIAELKATKKESRQNRLSIEDQVKDVKMEIKEVQQKLGVINDKMNAMCIAGRNKYSKTAIQADFAQGIKELDQESAMEEDEANFDPEHDIRDYEEVAKALKVFCVSARAYQKLSGRLKRDGDVAGFQEKDETEIPQLQAHCKKLTEKGRASNCRRFLNDLSQLLNSLALWASNDGTGMNLTDAQRTAEAGHLKKKLENLEKGFDKDVDLCMKDLKEELEISIFDKYPTAIAAAIENAPMRVAKWSSSVNKLDRSAGGYYWATFKAITRRNGIYTNPQGLHDWNAELCAPILIKLANDWEKVFVRRLPLILNGFKKNANAKLNNFHSEVEKRCFQRGVGIAGISLVKQQLATYGEQFNSLIQTLVEGATEHQREASRAFQPVIQLDMTPSYEDMTAETGSGQYVRMKSSLRAFMEQAKQTMFQKSCQTVKDLLKQMCREIERGLADGADEAFIRIRRDYMQVVGVRTNNQVMSKAERVLRADICNLLEQHEKDHVDSGLMADFSTGDEDSNEATAIKTEVKDESSDFEMAKEIDDSDNEDSSEDQNIDEEDEDGESDEENSAFGEND